MKEKSNETNWIQNEQRVYDGELISKKELCFDSYKHVENVLRIYDKGLAELFSHVARHLAENNCYEKKNANGEVLHEQLHINGIFANIDKNGEEINLIPSEEKGDCHENCVLLSDCHWNGRGVSFQKYAKEIVKYWLNCIMINKRTLIVTTSWDENSFRETYKDEFDIYSKRHRLVVILITGLGVTIVYLGK